MNRNEYRRAFIMLRAAMPGYGGHVRLEKRTLTGSMYFIITAPQGVGELSAALVGQRDGAYYAAPIGPLSRDRRGQLALAWTFDPRAIDGRPLEAYAWVAVVATGGPCALALTGNVEGSRPVDARALEAAACALFAPVEAPPAADLPEPAADEPAGETRGDVKVYTLTRSRLRRPTDRSAEAAPPQPDPTPAGLSPIMQPMAPETQPSTPEPQPDPTPAGLSPIIQPTAPETQPSTPEPRPSIPEPQPSTPESQPTTPAGLSPIMHPTTPADQPPEAQSTAPEAQPTTPEPRPSAPEPQPSTPEPQPATPASAAKGLGLDITVPWPGAAEALRRLFATQAPAADAPADGFTYVAAPMPAASGYPCSLAGLKVADGRIAAIRYALPARRAPEPPAGLEASQWLPGHGEAGFWVSEEAVER